jgi:hypothetical protein
MTLIRRRFLQLAAAVAAATVSIESLSAQPSLQAFALKIPLPMLGLRRSAENHLVWIALIGRLLREISERGWRRSLQCSVE